MYFPERRCRGGGERDFPDTNNKVCKTVELLLQGK